MSSVSSREIDKVLSLPPRSTEMQVLCLGLSRTGTMSMYTALNKLGYKCYHMIEVPKNRKTKHLECWHEGLSIKLNGKGKKYGAVELDKILRDYSAVTDAPCVNFSDELVATYPKAKVILTNRDPDKWLVSVNNSLFKVLGWRLWNLLARIERRANIYTKLLVLVLRDYSVGEWHNRADLRRGFILHYDHIRSIVPKDNLLEFRSEDGWAPLCQFLGKPIPDEPYPHVNEGDHTANIHKVVFCLKVAVLLAKAAGWASVAGVAAWAVRYLRQRGLHLP